MYKRQGYTSSATGTGGGAYARGYGVVDSSQTTTKITESFLGGAAGAAVSPSSTMNRGIQTDVADGPVADGGLGAAGGGLGAAGGAASSTFMQSTMVKNVYASQQAGADSSFVDGSVYCLYHHHHHHHHHRHHQFISSTTVQDNTNTELNGNDKANSTYFLFLFFSAIAKILI